MIGPAVVIAKTPVTPDSNASIQLLAALPELPSERLWVRLRHQSSLGDISRGLRLSPQKLAALNELEPEHQFRSGDWLVIPSAKARELHRVAALDPSELRRTPPLQSPPPVQPQGVVRIGDTLVKLTQRYGMTLQELLRLNPGLRTAQLVAGTQIQLAQSAPGRPRLLLGVKPTTSGGASWPELPDFEEAPRPFGTPATTTGWIWPTRGVFSSGYGWRWGRMHKGIDLANNVGTPVVAAKDGQVVFAGWHDGGYGYLVTLAHPDGSRSLYAHNSRLLVKVGQTVQQGQQLSEMGSTGRSTGPHCHFEIHPAGNGAVNPLQFLPPRA